MRKRRPTSAYYTPPIAPSPPSLTVHKPLADLTREETLTYLEQLASRLRQKQARERAYLERRAARGTHTPTDEAYESDQLLEAEILAVLNEVCEGIREGLSKP